MQRCRWCLLLGETLASKAMRAIVLQQPQRVLQIMLLVVVGTNIDVDSSGMIHLLIGSQSCTHQILHSLQAHLTLMRWRLKVFLLGEMAPCHRHVTISKR